MALDTASEPQQDVVRVQEQLLELLRMAGTESPPPRREVAAKPVALAPSAATAATTPAAAKAATATATVTARPPGAGECCSQCGSDTPWGKSSWCPDCGYYPKAGFEGTGITISEDEIRPTLLSILPVWVLPTVLGAVGILVSSVVTRFVFHDDLQRAFVALTQCVVCVGILIFVHCRASFLSMGAGRNWMAFVNPGETWALVMSRMPATKLLVLLLGWSLAGAGSSLLIGLDVEMIAKHVAEEVKGRDKVTFKDIVGALTSVTKKAFKGKNLSMDSIGQLMEATGDLGGNAGPASGDLEGSIGSLAETSKMLTGDKPGGAGGAIKKVASGLNKAGEATTTSTPASRKPTGTKPEVKETFPGSQGTTSKDPASPGESLPGTTPTETVSPETAKAKETVDYWVFGYTTNSNGELRSLLLAIAGESGRMRYAQKLGIDQLSAEDLTKLSEQLKPYRVREPAIPSPYGGKWVNPVVKCRVQHDGLNSDSRPINPMFQSVILP